LSVIIKKNNQTLKDTETKTKNLHVSSNNLLQDTYKWKPEHAKLTTKI